MHLSSVVLLLGLTPSVLLAQHADSLRLLIEKDRVETEEWLKSSPTSYLATVNRVDFGESTVLTVGAAADNDVRIADSTIASRHLRVTVEGDSFRVEALDEGAHFTFGQETLRSGLLPPSRISIGRFMLRLSHQRYPAIIVYDPLSSRFREYKGLAYFPYDHSFRYILPLTPNPKADTMIILSTRGNRRKALRVGWFDFNVGPTACRLEVSRLLEPGIGEKGYSIFFRDGTSGVETYPMGRYVEAEELPDGRFVLDFNTAYNPACAFSDHYNCPIPPRDNHLRARIAAGEKDSHYIDH